MNSSLAASPHKAGNLLRQWRDMRGKTQLDLQPTLRASKNSPAIRQFSIHTWDHLPEERRAGMCALIDMLAAGKLHPRIHARLPLTDAVRAHEMLESGTVLGKLLLVP